MYPKLSVFNEDSGLPSPPTAAVPMRLKNRISLPHEKDRRILVSSTRCNCGSDTDGDSDEEEVEDKDVEQQFFKKMRTKVVVDEKLLEDLDWLDEWYNSIKEKQNQATRYIRDDQCHEVGAKHEPRQHFEKAVEKKDTIECREIANKLRTFGDHMIKREQERIMMQKELQETFVAILLEEFEKLAALRQKEGKLAGVTPSAISRQLADEWLKLEATNCPKPINANLQPEQKQDLSYQQLKRDCALRSQLEKKTKSFKKFATILSPGANSRMLHMREQAFPEETGLEAKQMQQLEKEFQKREKKRRAKLAKLFACS